MKKKGLSKREKKQQLGGGKKMKKVRKFLFPLFRRAALISTVEMTTDTGKGETGELAKTVSHGRPLGNIWPDCGLRRVNVGGSIERKKRTKGAEFYYANEVGRSTKRKKGPLN